MELGERNLKALLRAAMSAADSFNCLRAGKENRKNVSDKDRCHAKRLGSIVDALAADFREN